jgi:hypothetical protein
MNVNTHSNIRTPEQLQLKSRCPHVPNATQTGCEQLDTPQTRNTVQTCSTCKQQDISRHTDNIVQSVSELPELSLHPTESEQFYNEISDGDATGTAPSTEEQTVQPPLGNLCHIDNTVQNVSELPEFPLHPTEPEQFYNEISDGDATGTAPTTEDHPVQLPLRVTTHSPR